MDVGDVVNMTSWTHYQPNIQAGYRAPKGRVGVFLLLGDADKKAPESFDCVAAINNLGWFPKQETAPTPPQPIYDESKERELFEAFYSERAKTLPLSLGNKPVRYAGGQYVNDFALFGWMVWLECAQSRAKSVEVGHE